MEDLNGIDKVRPLHFNATKTYGGETTACYFLDYPPPGKPVFTQELREGYPVLNMIPAGKQTVEKTDVHDVFNEQHSTFC
jgi:hypothetical protein